MTGWEIVHRAARRVGFPWLMGTLVLAIPIPHHSAPALAQSPPPVEVNIQGALRDSMGAPIVGPRDYRVRFFDAASGGNQLGGDATGTVTASNTGVFNIELLLPPAVLGAPGSWYELAIDTDTPADGADASDLFADRIKVNSVPFALLAADSNLLGGVAPADFATDAEVTAGLAGKADAGHTHDATDIVSGQFGDSQIANNLSLDGATIENTAIGLISPSTGSFTHLSASGDLIVGGKIIAATLCVDSGTITYDLSVGGKISAATICAASASIDTASFVTDVTIGGTLYVNGSIQSGGLIGITDADTLDGLDSLQFLRRDVDDTFEGSKLTVDGMLDVGVAGVSSHDVNIHGASPGSRIFWDASKASFRVGTATGSQWDDGNIGENSIAMGFNATASGRFSTAIGYETMATGPAALAIGAGVQAASASQAFGLLTTTTGYGSTALGTLSIVDGTLSTALGAGAYVYGYSNLAAGGTLNFASGSVVTSLGSLNYTIGDFSQTLGAYNQATGAAVTTLGVYNYNYGIGSTVLGALTYSYGYGNLVVGGSSGVYGNVSTAVGQVSYVEGDYSSAFGQANLAVGDYSQAVGAYNFALGDANIAMGLLNYATATESVAMGYYNIVDGTLDIAIGTYNQVTGDYSAAIGGGNLASGYESLAMGLGNDATGAYSVAMGSYAQAVGYDSVAVGGTVLASEAYSTALGYDSLATNYAAFVAGIGSAASGAYSTAVGVESVAGGDYSTALGFRATTGSGAMGGFAVGTNSQSSAPSAMALGYGTVASGAHSTSLGSAMTVSGDYSFGVALSNQAGTDLTQPNTMAVVGGNVVIGSVTATSRLVVEDDVAGFVVSVTNDGNSDDRDGLLVQAGADDGSGQTDYLLALDGDGDPVGALRNDAGAFMVVDLSDAQSKVDVQDTSVDGLEVVNHLRVVDFKRASAPAGKTHHGFIAQEAQEVFPYMVTELSEDLLGISKEALIPILTRAIQQQQQLLESQEKEYESRLDELSRKIEILTQRLETFQGNQ